MKIVNEKGKLFGLVNIVDLLVLLFILAVAAGIAWKIFGNQIKEIAAPTAEVTYTVRIKDVSPEIYEELKDMEFPQQLVTSSGPVADAHLTNVEAVPTEVRVVTEDGKILTVVDESKTDIICTVNAKINNSHVIKLGTQEVQLGKSHIVKTKLFEMTGVVESLTLKAG
jgi:hypothetical protein